MSEADELRRRFNALESYLAEYQDALEQHLYDVELKRVERSHGLLNSFLFFGAMFGASMLVRWLDIDLWLVEAVIVFVLFFAIFAVGMLLTEKPMKREIDKLRKPLAWLRKPSWRESND